MFGLNKPFNSKKQIISLDKKLKAEALRQERSERNKRKQEEIAKKEQQHISQMNKIASLEADLRRLQQLKSPSKQESNPILKPLLKQESIPVAKEDPVSNLNNKFNENEVPQQKRDDKLMPNIRQLPLKQELNPAPKEDAISRLHKIFSENEVPQQKVGNTAMPKKTEIAPISSNNLVSPPIKDLKSNHELTLPVTDRSQKSKEYVAVEKKIFEEFLMNQMKNERLTKSSIANYERKNTEQTKNKDFLKPLGNQMTAKTSGTEKKVYEHILPKQLNNEKIDKAFSKTLRVLKPEIVKIPDPYSPSTNRLLMNTSVDDRLNAQNRRKDYSEKVRKELVPEISVKKKTEIEILKEKYNFRRPLVLKRTKLTDLY